MTQYLLVDVKLSFEHHKTFKLLCMISAQTCARWKHMKYHLPAMAVGMIVFHITQPLFSRHATFFLLEEASPGVIKKV